MAGKLPTVMGKDGLYGIVFYKGRIHDYEIVDPSR